MDKIKTGNIILKQWVSERKNTIGNLIINYAVIERQKYNVSLVTMLHYNDTILQIMQSK